MVVSKLMTSAQELTFFVFKQNYFIHLFINYLSIDTVSPSLLSIMPGFSAQNS